MDTSSPKGKQWRFESIDIRAGMGIALWREEREAGAGIPPEYAPALFFAPPHFQPEPIVNLSVALCACRGLFAPGLYIDEAKGTEAFFATPELATEFLRRAYVGGASGDGGDGGDSGGPTPLLPNNQDPGGEPPPIPDSALAERLVSLVRKFNTIAKDVPLGSSEPFTWSGDEYAHLGKNISHYTANANDAMILGVAALELIQEMLSRMPALEDGIPWFTWYDNARELASMLVTLGIADLLLHQPCRKAFEKILLRSNLIDSRDQPDATRFRLCWLFLFGPRVRGTRYVEDLVRLMHELDYWLPIYNGPWSFSASSSLGDPLDFLSRMPLPKTLHTLLPRDISHKASLYHLLNLFVSEPQVACYDSSKTRLVLSLALIAAAHITTTPHGICRNTVSWSQGQSDPEVARRAIERAEAWLIEHLPRAVYNKSYEAIIGKTKTLRYFAPA